MELSGKRQKVKRQFVMQQLSLVLLQTLRDTVHLSQQLTGPVK